MNARVRTSAGVYAMRARTREHIAAYVRGALEKGRMWSRRRAAREQVTPLARSTVVDITQGTMGDQR